MKTFFANTSGSTLPPVTPTPPVNRTVETPSTVQRFNWCFTIYPDCFDSMDACYDTVQQIGADSKWAIFGLETCPTTKRIHFQCYAMFEERIRFTALIKKYHKTIHWTAARGSTEDNFNYCSKEDPEPLEFGTRPVFENNGKREKERWKKARTAATESRMDEVDDQIFVQHYRSIKAIANDYRKSKTPLEVPCGYWLYGVPGSGKSHKARTFLGEEVYLKGPNKWWDNYQNEPVVVIEDLDPSHSWMAQYLKVWADIYPFAAEQKGSCCQLRPTAIVVTSNYKIEDLFPNLVDQEALKRRFKVEYFPFAYGRTGTLPLEEDSVPSTPVPTPTGAELTPASQFVPAAPRLTRSVRMRPVEVVDLVDEDDSESD